MANYPFKMEPSIYAAFSGPNFHYWKMSVEEYIFDKERDLYLALKGVDYKPNHMSKKDWQLLDKKVLEIIRSGLPQTIASNILHETTSKGAMDALDRLYGTPSASDKMYLMRKLVNMRLSDSELIHNHLNEFDATLSHLSTMDVKFEDEVTALLLLSSLPEGWKDAVMTVSESEFVPSKLKYNDVVGAIVNEDLRRRSSRGGTSSSLGIKQEKKQMDRVKPASYQASVGFVQRVPKLDLPEVAPEAKKKAAEAKSRGDDAFKTKDYHIAVDAYTQAIDLDPTDATLLSNRSLCWMRLGQAEHALADAKACRALRPDWPKACYHEVAALRLLQKFDEAANSFYEGVTLDPENKELVNAFREAVEAGRKFHGTNQEKS